jgi:acetyl-CoA carboxylase carboxyl transferase subunit beta
LGEGPSQKKNDLPNGLWHTCTECGEVIYITELQANSKVCPKCDYHVRLTAVERLKITVDEGSFQELFGNLESTDPLGFPGYPQKLVTSRERSGLNEAVVTGTGRISEIPAAVGIFDFNFIGGSMGSVVGEKVCRIAEHAYEHRIPLVIVSAGGGGARMHECMFSLMQMAKTSAAMGRLKMAGIPFISIITHPTMGGVSASFASLGDVILAEPKALTGFAGPRVIEQTIGHRLPDGFQSSEFMLEHGMIDAVVRRKDIKPTLTTLLRHFANASSAGHAAARSVRELSVDETEGSGYPQIAD